MNRSWFKKIMSFLFMIGIGYLAFLPVAHPDLIESKLIPDAISDPKVEEETWLSEIHAPEAWKTWEANDMVPGEDIVVAVLDSGVNVNHPDLEGALWTNDAEKNGLPGVDDDGNGYIDDIYGVNLVNSYTEMRDTNGHGTQMAGLIAMTSGDGGGAGLAYGCKIMPVKCTTATSYNMDTLIKGIEYAVREGADVINMSLATEYDYEKLRTAIEKASESCVIVAAAGNENSAVFLYPAAYPSAIGVVANEGDVLASYSNWDAVTGSGIGYDIAAPGHVYTADNNRDYKVVTGTSASTAIVSAAVAMFKNLYGKKASVSPDVLREKFLDCMKHTVTKNVAEGTIEYRVLNMEDMVRFAIEQRELIDKEAPVIVNQTASSLQEGKAGAICVQVSDNIQVSGVTIHYRRRGESAWKQQAMSESEEGTFQYQWEEQADEYEFYVSAFDGTNRSYYGTANEPCRLLCYRHSIDELTFEPIPSVPYTGQEICSLPVVRDGDYILVPGVDYETRYENNREIGTAVVTVYGKGLYVGETILYYFIIEASENKHSPSASSIPSLELPTTVTTIPITEKTPTVYQKPVTTTKTGKMSFGKWKICRYDGTRLHLSFTQKGVRADGYRIYVSTKKNGTYRFLARTKKKTIHLKRKWNRKKKYYIRVVAYRKVKGTDDVIRSKRSPAKRVK